MTAAKTTPTDVTVSLAAQTMTITWADGYRTVIPLEGLRLACPCVECRGGHAQMGAPLDPAIFKGPPTRQWRIIKMETVGNYALQIQWEDGHNAGVYTWKLLRTMMGEA
jgi:DUF971 family protein